MRRGRALIAVVGLVAVAAVAAYVLSSRAATPDVQVAEATKGDLAVNVVASGKVGGGSQYDLYPPMAGTLATIDVTEGQEVIAGQLIATMDPGPLEAQLAQAKAAQASAVAQRKALVAQTPSAANKQAAQLAVNAAFEQYATANEQYESAKAGAVAATPAQIAAAEQALAGARERRDQAQAAYDDFYVNAYLPAPAPRDATLEVQLASLSTAVSLASANVTAAEQALAGLQSNTTSDAAVAATKYLRDQAYTQYLSALAQQSALEKASDSGAALAAADAGIQAATAAVALAEDALARSRFVAPADGVVLFNSPAASLLGSAVSTGGGPAAGAPVSPASAPFTVVSFDMVDFSALVDETDIGRIERDMSATILLDGVSGEGFAAEVDVIATTASLTPTGGTAFKVTLRFAPGDKTVLLGMNGSAEINVETVPDTLSVPIEALLQDSDGDFVCAVRDGRARRTKVSVGRLTDTAVEITKGLSEGDAVIVSGVSGLADGDRVRTQ